MIAGLGLFGSAGGRPAASQPATGSVAAADGRGGQRAPGSSAARARVEDAAERRELARLIALGLPIYCAGPRGNMVALTFDDGPGPYTRLALSKLRGHGIRATFFIVGRNIALDPAVTRDERAVAALGDHTFTHPVLTALAPAEVEGQLRRTKRDLQLASGGPVRLFR